MVGVGILRRSVNFLRTREAARIVAVSKHSRGWVHFVSEIPTVARQWKSSKFVHKLRNVDLRRRLRAMLNQSSAPSKSSIAGGNPSTTVLKVGTSERKQVLPFNSFSGRTTIIARRG